MSEMVDNTLARLRAVAAVLKEDRPYAAGVCADAMAIIHSLEKTVEEQTFTIASLRGLPTPPSIPTEKDTP